MNRINFRILLLSLIAFITACGSNENKGVWLPVKEKFYQTPVEIEEDSIDLIFVDYMGFNISLDNHFLSRGVINQGITFENIKNDTSIINKLKIKEISTVKFYGDNFRVKEFENLYDVSLKKQEDSQFIIYDNKNNIKVGEVITDSNDGFIIILIKI